jgi:hypothetical protein
VTLSPDALAANYDPESDADPKSEIEALAEMAADYGYRLVPVETDEVSAGAIPPPFADDSPGMIARLAWLNAAIRSAAAAERAHKREKEDLSARILESWIEAGRTGEGIPGFTAFTAPQFSFVKRSEDTTTEELLDAMRASGLGHLVKNTYHYMQTLAILKEMRAAKMEIPAPLAALIELKESYQVQVKPAGKKKIDPAAQK